MTAKKDLVLHIGMGKTGTTALQNFFWENRKVLAARGILYPDLGIVSGAHHLLTPELPDLLRADGWKSLDPAKWVPTILAAPEPRILLSSELLAWMSDAEIAGLLDALLPHFNVRACIYLRRQDNIIMAGYNQQIKAGTMMLPLARALPKQLRRFDYVARIAPWAARLGDDAMVVRPYERAQFPDRDLISDFLQNVLGIDDETGFIRPSDDNPNPRFPPVALEFKRLVNAILTKPAQSNRFNVPLMEAARDSDPRGFEIYAEQDLLSAQERQKVLDHFAEVNAAIARRFLGRPDGGLFVEPGPSDAAASRPPRIRDLVSLAQSLRRIAPDLMAELDRQIGKPASLERQVQRAAAKKLSRLLGPADATTPRGTGQDPGTRKAGKPAAIASAGRRHIVIHPGLPKTGTTSIQEAFHKNQATLLSRFGVLYPALDENHTKAILALFRADATANLRFEGMSEKALEKYRAKVRGELEADLSRPDWRLALISGEGISTLKAEEWRAFLEFLRPHCDEISVIFGVRNGQDLLRSTIQQNLKAGMVIEGQYAKPPLMRLRGRLAPAIDALGRDRIHIWDFDAAVAGEGGLLRHFGETIGLPAEATEILAATPTFRNQSLTQAGVEALAERNRKMARRTGVSDEEHARFLAMAGPKFTLPPEVLAKVAPLIEADDAWLAATFGRRRQGGAAPVPAGSSSRADGQAARVLPGPTRRPVRAVARDFLQDPSWARLGRGMRRLLADTGLALRTGSASAPLSAPATIKGAPKARTSELIVHFGIRKTGTSSIQVSLHEARQTLQSLRFLEAGLPNSSQAVRNAFADAARLPPSDYAEARRGRALRQIAHALHAGSNLPRCLISAEAIHSFNPDELRRMHDHLAPHAARLHYLGYMREPVGYLRSAFQEKLKTHLPPDFEFAPDRSLARPYHAIVDHLDALVGAENVTVLPFESGLFPGGDVVRHFLDALGVPPQEVPSRRVNESLSHLAVKALYTFRRLRAPDDLKLGHPRSRADFIADLVAIGGPSFRLHPEIERRIAVDNAAFHDWCAGRLGQSLTSAISTDESGIRTEEDLMTFDEGDKARLAEWLAARGVTLAAQPGAPEIAAAMHRLRLLRAGRGGG